MVIASHNLDCLLKDGRASPPLLRFVKQVTTVGLIEALGSEWAAWQALAWLLHLTTWAASPHHPDSANKLLQWG